MTTADHANCQQMMQSVIDAMPANIAIIDLSGTILMVNNAWCNFAEQNNAAHLRSSSIGCNYLAICQQSIADGAPQADLALQGIKSVLSGQQISFTMEYPCHSSERQSWYQMSVSRHDGPLQAVIICHLDISRRIQSETTLHKLSRAVQQSPVCVVITDHEGAVEFVNPCFTQMTGFAIDEIMGQNLRILKSGRMLPELYQQLWDTINAGQIWQGELLNRKKQGGTYWERATISPIRDYTGRITHFLAIKEDITEQKLLREQLIQSQKMESVGQLAGGLAHDFNNLLGIISGYASLLQLKLEDQHELQQLARHIQSATEKAATLTHGLLAYSRQQVIQLQHYNLNRLVNDASEFMGRILGGSIQLTITCSDSPLIIHADKLQIEQVLYNLAANARDAMSEGGNFTIETSLVPQNDRFLISSDSESVETYALLIITDSGIGMDRETIKRLFDPFFTTKNTGKGTGLGLSVVYGIIRQHNGSIRVQSKPGKGTVFSIYLPLACN